MSEVYQINPNLVLNPPSVCDGLMQETRAHIHVFWNPTSGNQEVAHTFLQRFTTQLAPGDYTLHRTTHRWHAVSLLQSMSTDHKIGVVIVGGDGFLHEIVNGILHLSRVVCFVALVPAGTGNDFFRGLTGWQGRGCRDTIVASIVECCAALVTQRPIHKVTRIDLGAIVFRDSGDSKCFANICSLGISSQVVAMAEKPIFRWLKRVVPGLFYWLLSMICHVQLLGRFNKEVEIVQEDDAGRVIHQIRECVYLLTIANGKVFGRGMAPSLPTTSPADGVLDITVISDVSLMDLLFVVLPNLYNHRLHLWTKSRVLQLKRGHTLKIRALDPLQAMRVEADGELVGSLPLCCNISTVTLPFFIPA